MKSVFYGRGSVLFPQDKQNTKRKDGHDSLTCKKTPEISDNSISGDNQKYTGNPYAQTQRVNQEGGAGFSEAVNGTDQCGICIEKRADPGQRQDKFSCGRTVKQKISKERAGNQEEQTAGNTEKKTAAGCFPDQTDRA